MPDNKQATQARTGNKMGYAPVTPLLLTMAAPAILSMLIQAAYNVVDSIFVSRISSQALSAISLAFPIQMVIVAINVGTSVGLNSLISRRLGERRQDAANDAANHGIVLAVISGLVLCLLGQLLARPFFAMSTDNPVIIEMGTTYIRIVTGLCVFSVLQTFVEKMLQATGNMIYPMISHVLGCVTNIILDPILIFGYFGAPKMGIAGAAVATVLGQLLGMCFCLFMFIKKNKVLHVSLKGFKFNRFTIRDIYIVGVPSIIMQAIGSVMITLLNLILISFSESAVNVLGIYYKLQSFVFMPIFGLNQGAMPILGFNFGAGSKERMMKALRSAIVIGLIIMGIGTLVFQTCPAVLLGLFNADAETLAIGTSAMRAISLCFIPAVIGIMFSSCFQSMGNGFYSLLISLFRQLIIIVPVAWLLSRISLHAVWYAFPIAEVFTLTTSTLMFIRLYRQKISKLEPV